MDICICMTRTHIHTHTCVCIYIYVGYMCTSHILCTCACFSLSLANPNDDGTIGVQMAFSILTATKVGELLAAHGLQKHQLASSWTAAI